MCSLLAAGEVSNRSVQEIGLTATRDYANPYTDVDLTAWFTGPDGVTQRVRGFWDDGRDFKVRFTPTAAGKWRYSIASTPSDPGLERSGAFSVTAQEPGSHGFLRRDPKYPTTFSFDDGTHFFMFGTTYYGIVANARAGGSWREAVVNSASYGINKVRMHVHASMGPEDVLHYPESSPFVDQATQQLDARHWRALDEVVRFLGEHGMLADLIVFPYRKKGAFVATIEQDRRYLRYVLARYAAFPNVIWCLVNEWNYSVLPMEYWNEMGRLVRAEDPWGATGGRLRALSIHQQTRPDWNFGDENWPSHAIIQFGVRNRGKVERVADEWVQPDDGTVVFHHGDEWGNYSISRNWTGTYPVVNDEYGYIGEPYDDSAGGSKRKDVVVPLTREKHRHIVWGIAVAGGYGSAGDKTAYADGRPYFSANWHDAPEYSDINHCIDFFTAHGFEYWKTAPHNELIQAGVRVYALAEPGRQYVFYAAAGGAFEVELAAGAYAATRFDPRTGDELELDTVTGGSVHRFESPDTQDWVFHLSSNVPPP